MTTPAPLHHALLPGTFDPFTLGHRDLALRALALFGRVTVAVAHNPDKKSLFGPEERVELARAALLDRDGIDVVLIRGLVVHACRDLGADVIVRGVRGGVDHEYEAQMARCNRQMMASVDTVLLAPAPEHAHISSTLVRQIATLGGDATSFVPRNVAEALRTRFSRA